MISWCSLRSASWRPMESECPLSYLSFPQSIMIHLDQMPPALFITGTLDEACFHLCPVSATSLQWWTTEEECLVMAHSCCTRSVNHTVSQYNTWNVLKGIERHTSFYFHLSWLFLTITGPPEESHCYHRAWVRRWHWVEGHPRARCG